MYVVRRVQFIGATVFYTVCLVSSSASASCSRSAMSLSGIDDALLKKAKNAATPASPSTATTAAMIPMMAPVLSPELPPVLSSLWLFVAPRAGSSVPEGPDVCALGPEVIGVLGVIVR